MSAMNVTLACDGPVFAAINAVQQERDQLRAEVASLVVTKDRACAAATDNKAEADQWHAELQRAEREVGRLKAQVALDEKAKATMLKVFHNEQTRAERAEAELATERARSPGPRLAPQSPTEMRPN